MDTLREYIDKLNSCITQENEKSIEALCKTLKETWIDRKTVYICGNGGSAANAIHIANDFHYGATSKNQDKKGLKVEALTANSSILTCLANDIGYSSVFSHQIERKGGDGDLLIVLSGSGNSKNILSAIEAASKCKMKTAGILGYDGGKAKKDLDIAVHFNINDMQIAEDMQLIVGHICMKYLNRETGS